MSKNIFDHVQKRKVSLKENAKRMKIESISPKLDNELVEKDVICDGLNTINSTNNNESEIKVEVNESDCKLNASNPVIESKESEEKTNNNFIVKLKLENYDEAIETVNTINQETKAESDVNENTKIILKYNQNIEEIYRNDVNELNNDVIILNKVKDENLENTQNEDLKEDILNKNTCIEILNGDQELESEGNKKYENEINADLNDEKEKQTNNFKGKPFTTIKKKFEFISDQKNVNEVINESLEEKQNCINIEDQKKIINKKSQIVKTPKKNVNKPKPKAVKRKKQTNSKQNVKKVKTNKKAVTANNNLVNKTRSIESRKYWSKEEDEILLSLFKESKNCNWNDISKKMENRTARQCKERYENHLAEDIKRENFSFAEDCMIVQFVIKNKTKWKELSKIMKGRTPNAIKNRWHGHLKSKSEKSNVYYRNYSEIEMDAAEGLLYLWKDVNKFT